MKLCILRCFDSCNLIRILRLLYLCGVLAVGLYFVDHARRGCNRFLDPQRFVLNLIINVFVLATISFSQLHLWLLGVNEPLRYVLLRHELLYLDLAALRFGKVLRDFRPIV